MTVAIFGVEFIVASAILRHRTKFQCGDCFYNLGQKVLQILHFVIHADTPNEFSIMVAPPQPLPDQCCYVWTRNVSVTLQHFLLGGGGGGSILTVPVFGVKYSRMKHTRCIFLNIFVQDCTCGSNSRKKNNRLHGLHILRLFLTKWSFKKDYNFNTSMFFPYFWS